MTTHTTFETSRLLAENGFTQPEFATGQIWYNEHGVDTFIGPKKSPTMFYVLSLLTGRKTAFIPVKEGAFFAPTATDILDRIGYGLIGQFFDGWIFCVQSPGGLKTSSNAHENPAEACAEAWLSLNK